MAIESVLNIDIEKQKQQTVYFNQALTDARQMRTGVLYNVKKATELPEPLAELNDPILDNFASEYRNVTTITSSAAKKLAANGISFKGSEILGYDQVFADLDDLKVIKTIRIESLGDKVYIEVDTDKGPITYVIERNEFGFCEANTYINEERVSSLNLDKLKTNLYYQAVNNSIFNYLKKANIEYETTFLPPNSSNFYEKYTIEGNNSTPKIEVSKDYNRNVITVKFTGESGFIRYKETQNVDDEGLIVDEKGNISTDLRNVLDKLAKNESEKKIIEQYKEVNKYIENILTEENINPLIYKKGNTAYYHFSDYSNISISIETDINILSLSITSSDGKKVDTFIQKQGQTVGNSQLKEFIKSYAKK
jgi:hypothetical protein